MKRVQKHYSFINTYEKKIKKLRDEYYNNPYQNNEINSFIDIPKILNILVLIICVIIIITNNFSFKTTLTLLIILMITNIIKKFLNKKLKLENQRNYEQILKKYHYLSINEYESKLTKYVSGPKGEYTKILNEVIEKNNINSQTKKIIDIKGNTYYIWTSQKIDKLILLNTNTHYYPEPKVIKIATIRYYRIDYQKQEVILKTETEELYFKIQAAKIFESIFKEKNYDNLTTFDPEANISDFEVFASNRQKEYQRERKEKIKVSNLSFLMLLIIIIIFVIVPYLKINTTILKIIEIIAIYSANECLKNIFSYPPAGNLEKVTIEGFENDPKVQARFNELKTALKIRDDYDTIYNTQKVPYKTWFANGYFHLFLDVAYKEVAYMAINPSNILYYELKGNECILVLKDKTFAFSRSAYKVFQKIMATKDNAWTKKILKNSK